MSTPDEPIDQHAQDAFAQLLLDRLAQGGEPKEVLYDAEAFTLSRDDDEQTFYLGNAFAEYQRATEDEKEQVIRVFLSTWFTSQFELPTSFDDAKADVLVTVRDRSYFEIDIPLCSDNLELSEGLIYSEYAECLAIAPVYDMPTSIRSLSAGDLEDWGVTLYEVIEVAKQNLREMTREYAQAGELYLFSCGDSHDAARILLTEIIQTLEVSGSPIALVPNREMLLITGEQSDEGLQQMLALAKPALEHERRITGTAFRLTGDQWHPWLPPTDHPLYSEFLLLQLQGLMGDYERQEELFRKRAAQGKADVPFLSRYTVMQNEEGALRSYTIWPGVCPALLPKTDYVMFMSSDEQGLPTHLAAAASWEQVEQVVGSAMSPTDFYPERYRVERFPTEQELELLGIAPWLQK
ncbi:hypothetical protein Pan181_43050 [Aeoliella mucimassa]|uniref:DUF1444 family protein n=2 Tax=Aeoliella mucimassa TaxID=2527972 RepID=A0A518ATM5_9BACT|nr:hypothetical protein Pan181_43050 [Aeoliella mucimassa]